jgi:hypothetical protein
MNNADFLKRTRAQSTAIYATVANGLANDPTGGPWTNAQICIAAGFDSSAGLEAKALEPQVSTQIRAGVDRYFATNGQIAGFAKQVCMDKDLGEHHLKYGGEYLTACYLNKSVKAFSSIVAWTNYGQDVVLNHKAALGKEEKMVMRLGLGMSFATLKLLDGIAAPAIKKMVKKYPAYAPLADWGQAIEETAASLEK